MSLIMALETYEGIVMTADRLSTLNYHNKNTNTVDCYVKTYNAHKLFQINCGYGLAFCGDGKLNKTYLVEQFITDQICAYNFKSNEPTIVADTILNLFSPYSPKTILILCGYFNTMSFCIEINCEKGELYTYPDSAKNKIVRYGETNIADLLLDKDKFYYGYATYRTQDAIKLLVYINQVTAKFQQFQEVLPTVSEKCDVLLLLKNGDIKWLKKNDLHA